ncbi:MAG: type II toxin-antitoxin system RelE/ParE family toxin [Verrucomicrobiota bacterium]|jgi:plasmid stabilization system protein ParE
MGYKVNFAPQALQRLEEIVRVIAKDNPPAAEKFGLRLVDRTVLLADFPELGRPYRKREGVRRLWCRPYWVYYRIQPERHVVEIMDFWHSARRDSEF